jgi:hypothetical protein
MHSYESWGHLWVEPFRVSLQGKPLPDIYRDQSTDHLLFIICLIPAISCELFFKSVIRHRFYFVRSSEAGLKMQDSHFLRKLFG